MWEHPLRKPIQGDFMKDKSRWNVSRVQPVESAVALVLAVAMCSDNTQSWIAKAQNLWQLEIITTSIIRSWNQNKEKEDSDSVKKKP